MRKNYQENQEAERELITDKFRLIAGTVAWGVIVGALLSKCERDNKYLEPRDQVTASSQEYSPPQIDVRAN